MTGRERGRLRDLESAAPAMALGHRRARPVGDLLEQRDEMAAIPAARLAESAREATRDAAGSRIADGSERRDERPLHPPCRSDDEEDRERLPANGLGGFDRQVVELGEKMGHGQESMVATTIFTFSPWRGPGLGRCVDIAQSRGRGQADATDSSTRSSSASARCMKSSIRSTRRSSVSWPSCIHSLWPAPSRRCSSRGSPASS